MALPTLVKTWQFAVNVQTAAQGSALATNRRQMRAIKNALLAFGTNPWTVRQSCDSTASGSTGDGVDRWTADTNLVWNLAGNAHSWIILRQTGIMSTFEVCIDLNSALSHICTIVTSTSAFSGGSTTARPTATNEVVLYSSGLWTSSGDSSHRYHIFQSTDGQCTRIHLGYGGNHTFMCVLDKPNNPTSGWTNPYACFATFGGVGIPFTAFVAYGGTNGRMRNGSTTGNLSMTVEGWNNSFPIDTTIGNIANEIDSSWDMWPIGIASPTSGVRGRHGSLFDLWFISSARALADMIPGDGSNQFACFTPVIEPWNGSAAPAFS